MPGKAVRILGPALALLVILGAGQAAAAGKHSQKAKKQRLQRKAAPHGPLGHAGRWITDSKGRVVVLHGLNMVYKLPPYYPSAIGFGEDDAAFLASEGYNTVRVGVIWKALEPTPGTYDPEYLNKIAETVDLLGKYGIVSMLD